MMNTDTGALLLSKNCRRRRAAHAAEKTADAGALAYADKILLFPEFCHRIYIKWNFWGMQRGKNVKIHKKTEKCQQNR